MRVVDLAEAIAPGVEHERIGIRPGEKLHEILITADEARHTIDAGERFVVLPEQPWWDGKGSNIEGRPVSDGFSYTSDTNTCWLSPADLRQLLG
jgi:UDP-N-acetylglucosamine 4,6-dehydratase